MLRTLIMVTTALAGCRQAASEGLPTPDAEGRWHAAALVRFNAERVLSLAAARDSLVVVALWATWCAPCVAEMAELEAFAQAHPQIVVLGLATDAIERPEEAAAIQKVLDGVHPRYPQGRLGGGEGPFLERLALEWDGILPKTVALDAGGLRLALPSPVTRATLEAALAPYLHR